MFGFLRPQRQDLTYRQAYVRCCMHQHLHYGVTSLPFLSYEAVLVYLLAVDAGLCPPPPASTPRCCRLRSSRALQQAADAAFGQYCSALGMLLAAIKLDDDVRDGGSLGSKLLRWKFRRAFQ